jgi:CheY-like chemotaxis protein
MMDVFRILLVDDNAADARLTQEALKEAKLSRKVSLQVETDGDEAYRNLLQQLSADRGKLPHLVLMDFNLPRRHGSEVLRMMKTHPVIRRIPVIMLTTSAADRDAETSYDLHANCFITKPVDIDSFIQALSAIDAFWFQVVKFPKLSP